MLCAGAGAIIGAITLRAGQQINRWYFAPQVDAANYQEGKRRTANQQRAYDGGKRQSWCSTTRR